MSDTERPDGGQWAASFYRNGNLEWIPIVFRSIPLLGSYWTVAAATDAAIRYEKAVLRKEHIDEDDPFAMRSLEDNPPEGFKLFGDRNDPQGPCLMADGDIWLENIFETVAEALELARSLRSQPSTPLPDP